MKKRVSVFLLLSLLFIPGLLHAQNKEEDADTLAQYVDSVRVEPAPQDDEEEGSKVVTDEKKEYYFLPNQAPEAQRDSLQLRRITDSQKAAMAADKDFWYANFLFKKKKEEKTDKKISRPFYASDTFQTILWILIIVSFVAFLIIYLSNSNVRLFRSSRSIPLEEEGIETDDIFAINYQKEIDKAIAAGNYRLAVRLLFLRLLKKLSDKNVIQYAHGRTNFDYLLQVSQTAWYKPFFRLTRHYEYVWYGLFEIDSAKFDTIKNDFTDLERQL